MLLKPKFREKRVSATLEFWNLMGPRAPEPALVTPEPALVTPEPALVTPEPALVTPELALVPPEPALAGLLSG